MQMTFGSRNYLGGISEKEKRPCHRFYGPGECFRVGGPKPHVEGTAAVCNTRTIVEAVQSFFVKVG